MPWLVVLALREDGWHLRQEVIWHKPNPMPESVRDRPTRAHEYLYLLSKNSSYFYDADAIREPATSRPRAGLATRAREATGSIRRLPLQKDIEECAPI